MTRTEDLDAILNRAAHLSRLVDPEVESPRWAPQLKAQVGRMLERAATLPDTDGSLEWTKSVIEREDVPEPRLEWAASLRQDAKMRPEPEPVRPDPLNALLWQASPPQTEAPGPLSGWAVVLKDNLLTRDVPTTAASRMLAGWRPPVDATVWSRLRRAGAWLAGKANLDEFGMGSSGEHSAFGPTLNPRDPARVPGGSSSGSAAAVAAGWARVALGSDTGGSIRLPAAYCRLFGFKPSYGAVSRFGLIAFASSLDQVGWLARCVEDLTAVFDAVAGPDPQDATSYLDPVFAPSTRRLAWLKPWIGQPGWEDVELASRTLRDLGFRFESRSAPSLRWVDDTYAVVAAAEAASNLARFDGRRFGLAVPEGAGDPVVRVRQQGFGDEVKRRILLGTAASAAGGDLYLRAERMRHAITRDLRAALEGVDAIVAPTSPVPGFGPGARMDDPLRMYETDRYTAVANLAGLCALTVPLPSGDGVGFPSVQLIAAPGRDRDLLALAAQLERAASLRDLTAPTVRLDD